MEVSRKYIVIIGLLLIIGAAIFLTGYSGGSKKSSGDGEEKSDAISTEDNLITTEDYIEPVGMPTPEEALSYAAEAIEAGETEEALKMFDESSHNSIRDFLNELDSNQRERLANDLSNATLEEKEEKSTLNKLRTYTIYKQVEGWGPVVTSFQMIKLPNGNWGIFGL